MAFSCCSFKFYVGDLYPTAMPLMWSGSTRFISASINLIKFLTYVMVRNKYLTALAQDHYFPSMSENSSNSISPEPSVSILLINSSISMVKPKSCLIILIIVSLFT